jgi:uncharacterized membrane protein
MRNPLLTEAPKDTRSSIAVAGHPVHPMLVNFPIAYLFGAVASDVAYLWTGDPFWARVSLWIIGVGFFIGLLAGLVGTLDFMLVKEIRRHVTSWSHFLAAVMMLSIAAANWWMRVLDPTGSVMPWGVLLSASTALALATAGWLGGKLVFEYNVGTSDDT